MTWVRLDDSFPTNPKIARLSDAAFRLYVTALCHAAQHLTDGAVEVDGLVKVKPAAVPDLVSGGLFEKTPNGLQIHDFLEFNPARVAVLEVREKKREAGAIGGRNKAAALKQKASVVLAVSQPGAKHDARRLVETFSTPVPIPSPSPPSPTGKGEAISEEVGVAPKVPALAPPLTGPIFQTAGSPRSWQATAALVADLQRLYPSVAVAHELEKAAVKIRDGAVPKKTARGMPKFLHSWMGREQNSARSNGQAPRVVIHKNQSDLDREREGDEIARNRAATTRVREEREAAENGWQRPDTPEERAESERLCRVREAQLAGEKP